MGIKSGHTKSCGCRGRNYKHGQDGTKLGNKYNGMICRCYNTNYENFKSYGGRGIIVCNEWMTDKKSFLWVLRFWK